ncbi:MAG: hypothetical protein ACREHD_01615 [Pirellulales bacterium]
MTQSLVARELPEVLPGEDACAFAAADPFAGDSIVFEGSANDAREAVIVDRLVKSGRLSVIVLGGAQDLSRHVRALGDCEYLRVFVAGYPGNEPPANQVSLDVLPAGR